MPKKVTYWVCSKGHQHLSPKEADLCDNPYRGDEIIQWKYFEIGDKFVFSHVRKALSQYRRGRGVAMPPEYVTIWVVTRVETEETSSRPGPKYRFERAFYTIVSSDGFDQRVSGYDLKSEGTRIKNLRRYLLAYLRYLGWKEIPPKLIEEVDEVVRVVTAKANGFNPHLKETSD